MTLPVETREAAPAGEHAPAPLHPQMADALARNAALQPPGQSRDSLPVAEIRRIFEEARAVFNQPQVPVQSVEERTIRTRHGDIRCNLYRPEGGGADLPLIVYAHGGGWMLGSVDSHDGLTRLLCRESGAAVLSVDYPRAPETPPLTMVEVLCDVAAAAVEDAPGGIVLAGDSAGAHLAVLTALALPPATRSSLKGVISFYGVLSRRLDLPSFATYRDEAYGLSTERMGFYWAQLLTHHDGDPDRVDPALQDLSGLPPLLLVAAECDVLRDTTTLFAERAAAAGVPVTATTKTGMAHAFLAYGGIVEEAARTAAEAGAFLRRL